MTKRLRYNKEQLIFKIQVLKNLKLRICLIALTLLTIQNSNAAGNVSAKFAADDWCPFTCESPLNGKPGIITEVLRNALQNSGFEMNYEVINWARAMKLAESNKINGILGAYISDVPHFKFTKNAVIISRDCFYTSENEKWMFKDLQSLESRKIGINKDYSYGEIIDTHKVKLLNKVYFESTGTKPTEQNLKKLDVGRIDTILENELVIKYLNLKNKKRLFRQAGCLSEKKIYAAFNPKNPDNDKIVKILDTYISNNQSAISQIVESYEK